MLNLIYISLLIYSTHSALLLWMPKPVYFPALKPFTNEDFDQLVKDLNNPAVIVYRTDSLEEAADFHKFLNNSNALYLLRPTIDIWNNFEVQELDSSLVEMEANPTKDTLTALILDESLLRTKRSIYYNDSKIDELTNTTGTGPVLYQGVIPNRENHQLIIYSSRPLLLSASDEILYLSYPNGTYVDVRGTYTRLILKFLFPNGYVYLRYMFNSFGGYWSLNTVEVELKTGKYTLELTSSNNVTAPQQKSYHCEEATVFTDPKSNIGLYMYGIQAEYYASDSKFSDSYNCTPFMTGPILSGLLVTFIMLIGLAIGLSALASIKSMDRFDSSKTKQLSITVFE